MFIVSSAKCLKDDFKGGVSECPECGAGIKAQLDPKQDLTLSELTEEEVRQGDFFLCPICQIAWDADERTPYDLPIMSSGPGGFLSEITAGKTVSNPVTSNFRLLGYGDDGSLLLRDVGELAFARDDSPGPPNPMKLENQLGDTIEVIGSGYPKTIQDILNALRPCYCVRATIGKSEVKDGYEFDARDSCDIVEAVPVDYAIATEFIPEFANNICPEEFDGELPEGSIPHARRTLHVDNKPAADVYDTCDVEDLSEEELHRLADIVELQPTSNGELADVWGFSTGKQAYQYLSTNLNDFYYRDSESRICATERAEGLISES